MAIDPVKEKEVVTEILGRRYRCICCADLQAEIGKTGDLSPLQDYQGMICAGVEDMMLRYWGIRDEK